MQKLFGPESSGSGILNYHSSREERYERSPRLQALRCEAPKRPTGFLSRFLGGSRSRASRLTLFNIIALLLVLGFYNIMGGRVPAGTWTEDGFRFSVSAFSHANQVFASVRVTKEKGGVWTGGTPEITLRSGTETESFVPALPSAKGETAYVRTVFSLPESRQISCVIRFGEKTKTLTVNVKEE